jgi:hypothetical protein
VRSRSPTLGEGVPFAATYDPSEMAPVGSRSTERPPTGFTSITRPSLQFRRRCADVSSIFGRVVICPDLRHRYGFVVHPGSYSRRLMSPRHSV